MPRTRSNRRSTNTAPSSGNDEIRKGDENIVQQYDTSSPTNIEEDSKVRGADSNRKKRTVSDRSPALKSRKKTTTTATSTTGKRVESTPTKKGVGKIGGKDSEQKTNIDSDDKENIPLTPGVTPYWKVAEERGFSPRLTRSAKKSSRPSNIPRLSDASPSKLCPKSPMRSSSSSSARSSSSSRNNSSNETELLDSNQSRAKSKGDEAKGEEENGTKRSNTAYTDAKNKFCLDLSPEARSFRYDDHDRTFLVSTIKNLKMQVNDLKTNVDKYQKESIELKLKMKYDGKIKGMDERITKLSNEMYNQNMLLNKNNDQHEMTRMIHILREENDELRAKLDGNDVVIREHEQKLEIAESSNRRFVAEFESHHMKQKEMEALLSTLREENNMMRREADKDRTQHKEIVVKYEQIIEELKANQSSDGQDIETTQDERLNLSSELDGIVSGLEKENSTTLSLSDREAEMTAMNDQLLKRCQASEKEVEQKNIEIENLKESLIKQRSNNNEVLEITESLEKGVAAKEKEIKELNGKLSQQTIMNCQLLDRCEKTENEVELLKSEKEKIQASMEDALNHGQKEADEKVAKTISDMDSLRETVTEVKALNSELLEKHRLTKIESEQSNKENEILQQSLAASERRCEDLITNLTQQEAANQQLLEKKQLAERDNEQSKIEMKSLEETLADVKGQRDELENNVAKLVSTVESNASVYSAEKKELLEKLHELEKKLELSETRSEEKLKQMHTALELEKQNTDEKLELMNVELEEEKRNNQKLDQQLFQVMEKFDIERKKFMKQIAEKDFAVEEIQKRCKAMMKKMSTFNIRENDLCEKLLMQEEVRRSLHNRVMQLSGNIRVFIRVRPTISNETSDAEMPYTFPTIFDKSRSPSDTNVTICDDLTKRFIVATEPMKDRGGLSQRQKKLKFGFDNIFNPSHNQEDIWQATEPLIQSAVDGFNVCVFAYGQTGSGKTYTMLGNDENPGVITKSIKKLFNTKRTLEETSKGSASVQISVELLEIYNEQVRDLLSSNKGSEGCANVNLALNSNEAVGNVIFEANDEEEVLSVLEKAQKRRCVKATKSNAESSRSHLIFTMNYNVTSASGTQRKSKLSICDLAGSERLSKSESYGSARTEAQHINKSLSALSNVIEKLQQKSSHIPYRESKLTYLLNNSLGGDSKTLAIICCNPLPEHYQESTCSLRFAQKLNKVELKALGNISC